MSLFLLKLTVYTGQVIRVFVRAPPRELLSPAGADILTGGAHSGLTQAHI